MMAKQKNVVHILAGEIRCGVVPKTVAGTPLKIKLSWSPKNVSGEHSPHPSGVDEK